jgi:hypothetical protein
MMTGKQDGPARASMPTAFDWARALACTACLKVDWVKVTQSATGSASLGGFVRDALHVLGKTIEAEMHAEAAAARRAAEEEQRAESERIAREARAQEALRAERFRILLDAVEEARRASEGARAASASGTNADASATDASATGANKGADQPKAAPVVDPEAAQAAALLGVAVDASEDEIRAALRGILSASRLHPDHGGDGEEAKRLIAAKNQLIERARRSHAVRP